MNIHINFNILLHKWSKYLSKKYVNFKQYLYMLMNNNNIYSKVFNFMQNGQTISHKHALLFYAKTRLLSSGKHS
jgi:hypothetical protein